MTLSEEARTVAASGRLSQLAQVSVELVAAESFGDIVTAAVTHAAQAIEAAVTTLMLVEGDSLRLVAGRGLAPGTDRRWARFGLGDDNPASEAARTGSLVMVGSPAEVERRYPSLRGTLPENRSLVCIPAGPAGAPVAVLGLTFDDGRLPSADELDFLQSFASACGQALRRVETNAELQARAGQLAFLADASEALASSLDYRATLGTVADLAVRTLADWCAVDLLQNGAPVTVSVAHVDPAMVEYAWSLQRRYPVDPDSPTGSPNVIRTGRSELYAEISDDMLVAGARDEEHLRLSRELNLRSALVVPLAARGRTLGAITLIRTENRPPFTGADLSVAEDLGRRAGVAIDNAELFRQTQDVALQLQQAVLPTLRPAEGWDLATHYAPGDRADVGGDFYDALQLGDGRLAFVIGDVMGHGVAAAAAMAQVRAAIAAYVAIDPDPVAVVNKLDAMFALYGITRLVTLICGVADRAAHTVSFVNAGHEPPLLVTGDGRAEFVRTRPQRPLGIDPDPRHAHTIALPEGATLLLYTDGLIEYPGAEPDVRQAYLRDAASTLGDAALSTGIDDLAARCRPVATHDDITLVALRARPPAPSAAAPGPLTQPIAIGTVSAESLSIRTEHDGPVTTLHLRGELDAATAGLMHRLGRAALSRADCTTVLLDAAELTFIDSSGLGAWISLRNHAGREHRTLVVARASGPVGRVLALADVAPLFGIAAAG